MEKLKHKEASSRHYENNKDLYRQRCLEKRQRNKEFLNQVKQGWVCQCGETDPICCDFHHRDALEKDIKINEAAKHWGLVRLAAEVAKCDLLCSNCHRKLHRDLNVVATS